MASATDAVAEAWGWSGGVLYIGKGYTSCLCGKLEKCCACRERTRSGRSPWGGAASSAGRTRRGAAALRRGTSRGASLALVPPARARGIQVASHARSAPLSRRREFVGHSSVPPHTVPLVARQRGSAHPPGMRRACCAPLERIAAAHRSPCSAAARVTAPACHAARPLRAARALVPLPTNGRSRRAELALLVGVQGAKPPGESPLDE